MMFFKEIQLLVGPDLSSSKMMTLCLTVLVKSVLLSLFFGPHLAVSGLILAIMGVPPRAHHFLVKGPDWLSSLLSLFLLSLAPPYSSRYLVIYYIYYLLVFGLCPVMLRSYYVCTLDHMGCPSCCTLPAPRGPNSIFD